MGPRVRVRVTRLEGSRVLGSGSGSEVRVTIRVRVRARVRVWVWVWASGFMIVLGLDFG